MTDNPQTLTTSVIPSATPAPVPDPAICEEEAGGYSRYCARCAPRCASRYNDLEIYKQCLNSTFMMINYYHSQCWQHGGQNCDGQAVDIVCGPE